MVYRGTGISCVSAWQTLLPIANDLTLAALADANPTLPNGHTHPVTPLSEEPALGTGPHVTVLNVIGPQLHVAFLIIYHIPKVAHTLHVPGSLPHSTGHRALEITKQQHL